MLKLAEYFHFRSPFSSQVDNAKSEQKIKQPLPCNVYVSARSVVYIKNTVEPASVL
jgi:hypothetical protein